MLCRLYMPEDFSELYAIEEVCFQPPFRFGRRYMQRLVEQANSATWIAEVDGRMCGFAIVEWDKKPDGVIAYIQTLEVMPERRGLGIGGELMRRMEESARAADAQAIWLHVDEENAGAIRLYEAHGYICQERDGSYYPQGRAALIYAKTLESR